MPPPEPIAELAGTAKRGSGAPTEFELDTVAGWVWVCDSNGAFQLLEPFQAVGGLIEVAGWCEPWSHDDTPRRWLAASDGPWLVTASKAGVRAFCLLPLASHAGQLEDYLSDGWRCPAGRAVVGPPVIAAPPPNTSGANTPGRAAERWAYWLTHSNDGGLSLHGSRLSLTDQASGGLGEWPLEAKAKASSVGLASVRDDTGTRLVLVAGHTVTVFPPPQPGERLGGALAATAGVELDIGDGFARTPRLVVLPAADPGQRTVAVGMTGGDASGEFLRVILPPTGGIRLGGVTGAGHPVGAAALADGPAWVYLSRTALGRVNTLDQTATATDLQRTDAFDRVRVAGRVVALSGLSDTSRPVLRVYDLLSRRTFHWDDGDRREQFPLPAILGPYLFTADRTAGGAVVLHRHPLTPSPPGGRS